MAEKPQANADKLKVLSAVMDKIEKDFGKGSIMRMNSSEIVDVPVIPTGSITLDMALADEIETKVREAMKAPQQK